MALYIVITENKLTREQTQRYVVLGNSHDDARDNLIKSSSFNGEYQTVLTITEMSSLAIRVD